MEQVDELLSEEEDMSDLQDLFATTMPGHEDDEFVADDTLLEGANIVDEATMEKVSEEAKPPTPSVEASEKAAAGDVEIPRDEL